MNIDLCYNDSRITLDHSDLLADTQHHPAICDALSRLYETQQPQNVGALRITLTPPHHDTQNETTYTTPVNLNGAITELEQRAIKSVDLAELINEPVNRYSIARAIIRLTAKLARTTRG